MSNPESRKPWTLVFRDQFPWGYYIAEGDEDIVMQDGASFSSQTCSREEYVTAEHMPADFYELALQAIRKQEERAHLIAAAPEMLNALIEMREVCAACLRALSRTENPDTMMDQLEDYLRSIGIPDGFGVRAQAAIAKAKGESK